MERLFINGKQCDLTAGNTGFAKTLQCNDLANIASRQTNRTMSIKLPFTPVNDEIFGNLSFMGSQSQFPYQKNTCDLFVDNDKIINNGWANISQNTDKSYDIHCYDGTVDLWKKLENKTLGDLYIGEITHTKSLTAVTHTWSNDLDYCYILADYGGKTIVSGDSINIDYLVPSVRVKYLWDRIFETFGYTYSGDVFESLDFNNLWLTYPKGVNPEANDNIIPIKSFNMKTTNYNKGGSARYILDSSAYTDTYMTVLHSLNNNPNGYGSTDEHIKVFDDGKYNIKINGKINTVQTINQSLSAPVDIWFVKNAYDIQASSSLVSPVIFREKIAEGITFNHTLDIDYNFQLDMNETFSLVAATPAAYQATFINGTDFNVDFGIYDDPLYDFQNELKDFSITDFFKEIIWHYGLTFYKDDFSNNYEFRTLNEVMNGDVVNWSSKFQNLTSQKFTYSNYGQNNIFKYKYNEENANHNDGYLLINNLNLDEKKDVINSKIYSPESETTSLTELNNVHTYKMWDKEVKDDGELKYKGLDKKYYFMRAIDYEFSSSQTLVSESQSASTTFTNAKIETYQSIAWNEVINDYYLPLFNILNNTRIINAVFWLTPTDIANFDFRKLYYIEQLGGSFLINKITNYKVNKPVQVELIKVNR